MQEAQEWQNMLLTRVGNLDQARANINSLLQYKLGKNKNRGNLKRAARRNGIQHPFQISTEELKIRLEMCDKRNNYFRENGSRYREKHLLQRVEVARREGRDEAAKTILTIIKREQDETVGEGLTTPAGRRKEAAQPRYRYQPEGTTSTLNIQPKRASTKLSGRIYTTSNSILQRKPQFAKANYVRTSGTIQLLSPLPRSWMGRTYTLRSLIKQQRSYASNAP